MSTKQQRSSGLSPRGRGNRRRCRRKRPELRSIPAWAGEPRRCRRKRPELRSIPAWAGEPRGRPVPPAEPTVYPRVGGGTLLPRCYLPRVCGLSPRGRGNPMTEPVENARGGSIPAWAGEPPDHAPSHLASAVYPRVGGGTAVADHLGYQTSGLSPRGRGNHKEEREMAELRRSIPAWAGEPSTPTVLDAPQRVYPRVGGGTIHVPNPKSSNHGLSWAGEPPSLRRLQQRLNGLSPRGRGNLSITNVDEQPTRSIPAWAGEPQKELG